jgi:hypothetical protein
MRTGSILARSLAVLALAGAAQAAMALELGIEGAASNLQLPWAPVAPLALAADVKFPATNYFWGGEAWLTAPLGEDAAIRVSYERDPITRNSAIAAVQFERGIARISVGPRIGFLNSDSTPFSAGLSASVRLQWPGVAYISMRSDGGTAISVLSLDSDPQARTDLAAGLYAPNAIVSGILSAKRFNELDSAGGLVTDSLTRYAMTIDVFKKNVPYTAMLTMGYELRSKRYAKTDVTDSLGAVILGLDSTAQLGRAFKLIGGISTGAYVFGLDALKDHGPENSSFLFSANLGLAVETKALDFTPKPRAPKAAAAEAAPAEAKASEPKGEEPAPEAQSPAKPSFSRLDLRGATGLVYNNKLQMGTGVGWLDGIVDALFNLRAGAWGSIAYRFSPSFSLGGELGLDYFTFTSGDTELAFFDAPVHACARFDFGSIGVDLFGGAFINGIAVKGGGIDPYFDADSGARLRLGNFYVDGSYVFGIGSPSLAIENLGKLEASFLRVGAGFLFPIDLSHKPKLKLPDLPKVAPQ